MFKSDTVDMGTIKPNSVTEVKWEIVGDPNHIIHWQANCGCTANIKKEGNQFIAEFTEEDFQNLTADQLSNWYPEGSIPVTKGITVYLYDGKNLFVRDPNNPAATIIDPNKPTLFLNFIGNIDWKDSGLQVVSE